MNASEEAQIANITALLREGNFAGAQAQVLRALQKSPSHPRLNTVAAQVFQRQGRREQALYYAERACKAAAEGPERAACLWTLGDVQDSCGRSAEAARTFECAVALEPRSLPARQRIVQKLGNMGLLTRAVVHARQAVSLAPQSGNAFNLLMNTLMASGDVRAAVDAAEELLRREPAYLHAATAAAFGRNYLEGVSREESLAAHRRVGELLARIPGRRPEGRGAENPGKVLNIGILSADFREHSVSYFIEPLMRHLDRGAFTLHCYSVGDRDDARTKEMAALADVWRPCAAMDAQALAGAIRADGMDILIETSGLTRENRLEALALKPAPVQVSYCGYPNTTGLEAVDVRIVDSTTDPPGAERFCTEELVRLDPCFLCYAPGASPPVSPAPFEAGGAVTFGSFNTLLKVTDRVLETWASIAAAVPGGRLLLKGQQLADPEITGRMRSLAERAGLTRDRFDLVDFTRTPAEHLAVYSRVDIALDPFPYNGTTTICEAAWMGVPTVTLRGERHASRVGASLLAAMGLPELIAGNLDEYATKAVELASDHGRLRSLRSSLRERMRASILCDAAAFTRRFEGALRTMWERRCKSGA